MKQGKFHLNVKKNLFTVRGTEHWKKLSMKAVASSSLEILKIQLDVVLGKVHQVTLLEQGGVH